uniref:Uncharacterized protein n=1 Tax=Candidatus Kentrum sp. DK TaxID=2126562 RepID=A0A450S4M2_9GAMM|nr:MAG: hypothetical protein BECKDK2373C_GA0170839_101548 [Candidatus Kentron sp. DK]VFJ46722.1 MAG: hypothetical protein BECKDK2373B_GA0170837_10145 [Candidatus Kentron sp. DK]
MALQDNSRVIFYKKRVRRKRKNLRVLSGTFRVTDDKNTRRLNQNSAVAL